MNTKENSIQATASSTWKIRKKSKLNKFISSRIISHFSFWVFRFIHLKSKYRLKWKNLQKKNMKSRTENKTIFNNDSIECSKIKDTNRFSLNYGRTKKSEKAYKNSNKNQMFAICCRFNIKNCFCACDRFFVRARTAKIDINSNWHWVEAFHSLDWFDFNNSKKMAQKKRSKEWKTNQRDNNRAAPLINAVIVVRIVLCSVNNYESLELTNQICASAFVRDFIAIERNELEMNRRTYVECTMISSFSDQSQNTQKNKRMNVCDDEHSKRNENMNTRQMQNDQKFN